jgi:hypothetical protein
MAIIDLEDYFRVCGSSWSFANSGYASARIDRKHILLHRFLMNAPAHLQVDHINGNRLDCRRSNMRLVTEAQNRLNTDGCSSRPCSSKYVGVYRAGGKKTVWVAGISLADGTEKYLGRFSDEESAARARDAAAKKFRGEFARLNFPAEG